jgi:protein-disulfide isomerase
LIAFAESIGLDMDAFNACFSDNRYASEIADDLTKVKNYNITGTPSVFVNGVIVSPGFVPSVEQLSTAIDSALAGQ